MGIVLFNFSAFFNVVSQLLELLDAFLAVLVSAVEGHPTTSRLSLKLVGKWAK